MSEREAGPRTRIKAALKLVNTDIGDLAKGGYFAAGMASEGWCGGYAQALMDVQLVLNGVMPNTRDYWTSRTKVIQPKRKKVQHG